MPNLPFPGGVTAVTNVPRTKESLTNCFNNGQGSIIHRPGIDLISATAGNARGLFEWNENLYMVVRQSLLKVTNTTTGATTTIGPIVGNEAVVTAVGFNTVVIAVKGGNIYTLDKSDTLTNITANDNIEVCDAVAHINGRFVYIPSNGANPAFFSDIGAAGTVQAASFFDAEELPDKNTTVMNLRNTLYIGGTDSFELFRDTGASPVPFQRLSGARIDYGYIGGLVAYADTYAFVGREKEQDFGIYTIGQGRANKISNEEIDRIIGLHSLVEMQSAISNRFKWRGYDLVTFEIGRYGLGYYNGSWFHLSKLVDGSLTKWDGGFVTQFQGTYYSASNKKFGKLSDTDTEYGESIPHVIDIPFQHPDNEHFSAQSISLGLSQGFNANTTVLGGEQVTNGTMDDNFGAELVTNGTFVETLGAELVTNGTFTDVLGTDVITAGDMSDASKWTLGVGWSIGSGVATCDGSQVGNTSIQQAAGVFALVFLYRVDFTVSNYSAGAITSVMYGSGVTTVNITANGTYSVYVQAINGSNTFSIVQDSSFAGDLDDVSCAPMSDADDWTRGDGWQYANGSMNVDGTQTGNTQLSQTISGLTTGATYKLTFDISNFTAGAIVNSGVGGTIDPLDYTADGSYTAYIVATNTTGPLQFTGNINAAMNFDNVSLKEITDADVWTRGDGWQYNGGVMSIDGSQAATSQLTQAIAGLTTGANYRMETVISGYSAGFITATSIGGTQNNDNLFPDGTYTQDFVLTNDTGELIEFANSAAILSLTSVSLKNHAGLDAWIVGDGWTMANGVMSCDGTQTSNTTIKQDVGIEAGKRYQVQFEITELTAGLITTLSIGGVSDGTNKDTVGVHTYDITAENSTGDINIAANASFIGSIDNVSVREMITVRPTVGLALSNDNVNFGPYLFRDLGQIGQYNHHLEWNYPGGLGSYDGFMALRFYTTQSIEFDANGLFAYFRS